MQILSDIDKQIALLYDENIKNALQKTKLIDKRIEERTRAMRRKLTQFKNVCQLIRFQQLTPQPQSPDLPSLDSKVFTKSSDESPSPARDDESAKEENIKISKTQAKIQQLPLNFNQETIKEAKLQYQTQSHQPTQDNTQLALTTVEANIEVKKEYEPERIDMSTVQRSDNSTAKFFDSQKQSSIVIKGQLVGQDQSFTMQYQELEKTKNTNSFQSSIQERNLGYFKADSNYSMGPFGQLMSQPSTKAQNFLNPPIFSFSNIPQNQTSIIQPINNWQSKKVQQTPKYPDPRDQCGQANTENFSVENLTDVQVKIQQIDSSIHMQQGKLKNETSLLKSLDKSLGESAEDKSLSFNQICDQLDNFFKVKESHEFPNKLPQAQPLNVYGKQPCLIDISKLQVNPNFMFSSGPSQKVVAKTKNRLFKGKGRRKNSSEQGESD